MENDFKNLRKKLISTSISGQTVSEKIKIKNFKHERSEEFTSCTPFLRKLLKDILQGNKEGKGSRRRRTNTYTKANRHPRKEGREMPGLPTAVQKA